MLSFDHLKLTQCDSHEMQRFRRYLLGLLPGQQATSINVVHEYDDSCCRAEPWNVTLAAICQAVKPPARLAVVNLPDDRQPELSLGGEGD